MPTLPSGKLVNVDHIPVIVERLLAEGKTFRLSYVIGQCNLAYGLQGGFSQVYLVTLDIDDQNIKTRQAVLKQMLVKDSASLEKFQKEIEVMVISVVLQNWKRYYSPLKSVLTTQYFHRND